MRRAFHIYIGDPYRIRDREQDINFHIEEFKKYRAEHFAKWDIVKLIL